MLKKIKLTVGCLLISCFHVGCGDDGNNDKDTDVEKPDGTNQPSTKTESKWSVEEVEENVGRHAKLAVSSSGEVSIAYYINTSYNDGECTEVDNNPKPIRKRYDLKMATLTDTGWSTETIDSPLSPELPTGLAHAYTPAGDAAIAYTGGEPMLDWCGANDAIYTVKSGSTWTAETAATQSGEAATGNADSDSGFAVGWNPALTFDRNGDPAIVYQDQHFVYLQRDDEFRSDAELAWRQNGGWLHEAVDYGQGAGDSNAIVFDAENRPIVFTTIARESNIQSRHGVWAARREADGTWNNVKIHTGSIGSSIEASIDPTTDEPVVAFYSAPDYGVKVRRLTDAEAFSETASWDSEIVKDDRYNEGDYLSLAFAPDGRLALSYRRCRQYAPGDDSCDTNDEALIFAIKDGSSWTIKEVYQGPKKGCGTFTSLAFADDGTAYIAFQCAKEFMGEHSLALYVAKKQF